MRTIRFGLAVCLTLMIVNATAPEASARWRIGVGFGRFGGFGYGGFGCGGFGYGGFGYQRISYGGFGCGYGGGLSIYSGPVYPRLGGPGFGYGYSPLVIPTGSLYGLGPVRQMFFGAGAMPCCQPLAPPIVVIAPPINAPLNNVPLNNAPQNNGPQNNAPLNNAPLNNAPPKAEEKQPQPREANAASRARARKFMEFGDEHFGNQAYRAAYDRYKLAAQSAPDMVETYLRQGQSLVAVGSYELAARVFKRAMRLEPDWTRANFRLDDIYGKKNHFAKTAHLESLAAEAEKDPGNADLMLLVGVELLYDGQAKRSVAFFQRAKELNADDNIPLPKQPEEIANPRPMPPPDVGKF